MLSEHAREPDTSPAKLVPCIKGPASKKLSLYWYPTVVVDAVTTKTKTMDDDKRTNGMATILSIANIVRLHN